MTAVVVRHSGDGGEDSPVYGAPHIGEIETGITGEGETYHSQLSRKGVAVTICETSRLTIK